MSCNKTFVIADNITQTQAIQVMPRAVKRQWGRQNSRQKFLGLSAAEARVVSKPLGLTSLRTEEERDPYRGLTLIRQHPNSINS